jgi:hypothetical protein
MNILSVKAKEIKWNYNINKKWERVAPIFYFSISYIPL